MLPLYHILHSLLFLDVSGGGIMSVQEAGKESSLFQVAKLEIPQETTSLYFLVHTETHEKKNHVVLELEEILKISFTTFFYKIRNRLPDKESDLPMVIQQDSGKSEIRSIVS